MNRFIPLQQVKKEPTKILGEREMEVLVLASRSLSNRKSQIAWGLVCILLRLICDIFFSKLQVGSRTEAIYMLKTGLDKH
jgi:ATP/maltotriose-dependent transcriptional regulator MalT